MQSSTHRVERVNELIRRELALLLKLEVRNPYLKNISITDVITSRDLSSAKVFYTVTEGEKKQVVSPLEKAAGFFRTRLAKILDLRHTPALKFIYDPAPNTGVKMEELLADINGKK